MKNTFLLLVLFVFFSSSMPCSASLAADQALGQDVGERMSCAQGELTGTWNLVEAEDRIGDQWVQAFGDQPRGYFSFGQDGWASVQFMAFPLMPDPKSDPEPFLAYFGRFSVDERACTFTIQVEGALNRKIVGTQQIRSFMIQSGEVLRIGDGKTFRRVFERLRDPTE